jgi:hypothetical protein
VELVLDEFFKRRAKTKGFAFVMVGFILLGVVFLIGGILFLLAI